MGIAAMALVAGLAACSSSGGDDTASSSTSTALTDVTVGIPGTSSAFGFLYVAQEKGIFTKYGLNVKLEEVSNNAQIPGLVKGSFQFVPQAGTLERAALQDQPVVNVLSALTAATSALVVGPGINTPDDLKGKKIASAAANSTPTVLAKKYLADHGLSDSVKIVSLQGEQAQQTAFTSGQVDGLFLNLDSVIKAQGKVSGSKILATPAQLNLPQGAQAGLGTSKSFLKDHPDTVKAMIGASLEATKYTLEHEDEVLPIYAKAFGDTPDQAKETYEQIKDFIVLIPTPTDAQFATNASNDSVSLEKTITAEQAKATWDTTLTEEVFKELNCPDVCAKS
ncbi:ABC transporter substrate-binding protein [Asanoa sp. NPDC049573]|uniref:ABC transporter substrate-binding protein n=1 Tax=Asanoa sp. NPDC049573 TaxID=3155396 RepID=UPI00341D7587